MFEPHLNELVPDEADRQVLLTAVEHGMVHLSRVLNVTNDRAWQRVNEALTRSLIPPDRWPAIRLLCQERPRPKVLNCASLTCAEIRELHHRGLDEVNGPGRKHGVQRS